MMIIHFVTTDINVIIPSKKIRNDATELKGNSFYEICDVLEACWYQAKVACKHIKISHIKILIFRSLFL